MTSMMLRIDGLFVFMAILFVSLAMIVIITIIDSEKKIRGKRTTSDQSYKDKTTKARQPMEPALKVKYLDPEYPKLERIEGRKSDWIDLRTRERIELKKGEHVLIPLGVAIQLPEGYEAIVAPRSSAFKHWGILQTNSIGVIDETYCGDEDEWMMSVYATRDAVIERFDRICQFRVIRHQPEIEIKEVEKLGNESRGGFGSTGK